MLVAVAWPAAGLSAGASQPAAGGADVVTAFLSRRDPPVTSYRAHRRLEARNERFSKEGWLEVMTELGAGGFTYQVLSQGGSDAVRRKVLVPALEAERDASASAAATAFDTSNYRLTADGFEGGFARIRLTPNRKDKRLVDGWLLVTPRDTDLVAVKGQLAESPSFWTSRVDVVRKYARIAGVRVPVAVESTASVKIAGESTFRMSYRYEAINGNAVAR
jgi:hypothetical protein